METSRSLPEEIKAAVRNSLHTVSEVAPRLIMFIIQDLKRHLCKLNALDELVDSRRTNLSHSSYNKLRLE